MFKTSHKKGVEYFQRDQEICQMRKDLINLKNVYKCKQVLENQHKFSKNRDIIAGLDQVLLKIMDCFSD